MRYGRVFARAILEVFIRLTIAIVVEEITNIRCGLRGQTNPASETHALGYTCALTVRILLGAILLDRKRVINDGVAIVVQTIALLNLRD